MNTRHLLMGLCALTLGWMTACQPKNTPDTPENPDTPDTPDTLVLPESFPKKHLLEEFTGQDCGYCPFGMDCVHDFVVNDTNWVVVLHHYGFSPDHFSVPGSQQITSKLSVGGAPIITINRNSTKSQIGVATCFHPGYLPTVSKTQFAETTYASVVIANTYDAASRTLKVHISGLVLGDQPPALKLTALVKESGMIDYQADFYNTYEGWQEFRHCNAVRAFLTEPLGTTITVADNHAYEADYELTLPQTWEADNCAVVALLSDDFRPVVQVEQRPVVPNTAGGANLVHEGLKIVPIADYYPEPGATTSPADYSGMPTDTLTAASAYYKTYADYGFNLWEIQAYNPNVTVSVNNTACVPFAQLYLFTSINDTSIPTGSYALRTTLRPGTAYAGFRDDKRVLIEGSQYYYASSSYLSRGYLVPEVQWLIADGTLTITDDGWELIGHARNGADIHLFGKEPIRNMGEADYAPQRVNQRKNKLQINAGYKRL